MKGYEALWIPGTDHAGIATPERGRKKTRERRKTVIRWGVKLLINEVWNWREQYGSTIINQLKRLGSSCDFGVRGLR